MENAKMGSVFLKIGLLLVGVYVFQIGNTAVLAQLTCDKDAACSTCTAYLNCLPQCKQQYSGPNQDYDCAVDCSRLTNCHLNNNGSEGLIHPHSP